MRFGERADLIVAIDDGLAGLAPRQQCLNLGLHRDAAARRIPHAEHAMGASDPDPDGNAVVDPQPAVHREARVDDSGRALARRRRLLRKGAGARREEQCGCERGFRAHSASGCRSGKAAAIAGTPRQVSKTREIVG